jgi:hypothetical protein
MRMASSEMRRKAEPGLHDAIQEEMDIGAANSSSRPVNQEDLLGFSSPLPHPGRFELASSPRTQSPEGRENGSGHASLSSDQARPSISRVTAMSSYQGPSRLEIQAASTQKYRRFSFATSRRLSSTIAQQMYNNVDMYSYDEATEDDVEGDLGYAAAEGMEGNRRKVIVERLETVKAKNPVFTWC